MKKRRWNIGITLVLIVSLMAGVLGKPQGAVQAKQMVNPVQAQAAKEKAEPPYKEGQAVILYKNNTATSKKYAVNSVIKDGMEVTDTYEFTVGQSTITKKSGENDFSVSLVESQTYSTKELVSKLKARSDILYAEPNYIVKASGVTNDTYSDFQWGLDNQGQSGGTIGNDIKADTAKLNTNVDSKERVVAIVDTGVDYTHEDLKDIMWNNPYTDTKRLKGKYGYDFANYDDDPMDDSGHGSHCAGIIAGKTNNNLGIAGVARSSNVKIMALKMMDADGYGSTIDAIGCYYYIYRAQQLGVNVVAVNNSWSGGSDYGDDILALLINLTGKKGAVSVCSAGNESVDNDITSNTPSTLESPYVISVAASDEKGELASFSNYGKKSVDIAAPGTNILSSVSYPCFNPTIYTNKDEMCGLYYDFTNGLLNESTTYIAGKINYCLEGDGGAPQTVKLITTDYFGKKEQNSQSLEWKITGAREGESYKLFFPYRSEISETPVYDSAAVKFQGPDDVFNYYSSKFPTTFLLTDNALKDGSFAGNDEKSLYGSYLYGKMGFWRHVSNKAFSRVNSVKDRAIGIQIDIVKDGDYTVVVDDLAVSKSGVQTEDFGKYDFASGTSMAAPFVTGAVAAAANAYPKEDAAKVRARVLGSVNQVDEMKGKILTGGNLDCSKVEDPNPCVDAISFNKNNQIEMSGNFLNQSKVKLNNKEVTPVSKTDNKIVLNSAGYLNKGIEIEIGKGNYKYTEFFFAGSGKSFEQMRKMMMAPEGGNLTSDGNSLYYVKGNGQIDVCFLDDYDEEDYDDEDDDYDGGSAGWEGIGSSFTMSNLFSEIEKDYSYSDLYLDSEAVYANGYIWAIATLDLSYGVEKALVYYDFNKASWVKAANLPSSIVALSNITLGAYNGTIYLIGGFNESTGTTSQKVVYYTKSGWKNGVSIPEGRHFSKAIQVGNKLVVTLGGNDAGNCPANIIFDGSKWTQSKAKLTTPFNPSTYEYNKKSAVYYTGQIGLAANAIIYTGCQVDGVGDTFKYNMSNDTFTSLGYSLSKHEKGIDILATSVNDTFYIFNCKEGVYNEDYDDEEDDDYEDMIYEAELLKAPIQTGCIKIEDATTEGGYVDGAGIYLPGETAVLTAKVLPDYYLKKLMVDAKVVSGKTYRLNTAVSKNVIKVKVTTGAYVSEIAMSKKQLPLEKGKKYRLKASTYPSNAENKNIKWTSSNPSVAKVSSNGVVKAVSSKVGATAVITAKATDRGNVKAVCKVKIVKLKKKNAKVTAGGCLYKVTKSHTEKGQVTFRGWKKNDLKKVTIPASIRISGVDYQVTGISKDAFKKGKKVNSVIIKSKKLKSVSKGSLKRLSKKCVVTVPKVKKASYKKMLKKAGFKGKIK